MINESLIEVYYDLITKKMNNLFSRKPWTIDDVPDEYRDAVLEKINGGVQNG